MNSYASEYDSPDLVEKSTLVVIRGNSAVGKTSVAEGLRDHWGRGTAIIGQDVVRREMLWEQDRPHAVNIELLDVMCRCCLVKGYNVVLEGVLDGRHYGDMLRTLISEHPGPSHSFYLKAELETTIARHRERDGARRFSSDLLRGWYSDCDTLGVEGEHVLESGQLDLAATIARIAQVVGPVTYTPRDLGEALYV